MRIGEVQEIAKGWGSHFFDKDTLRFFNSKVHLKVFEGPGGVYFVTSEQAPAFQGHRPPRGYTVRRLDIEEEDIETVGEFNTLTTLDRAYEIAKERAEVGTA